jgi:hypothetical protein
MTRRDEVRDWEVMDSKSPRTDDQPALALARVVMEISQTPNVHDGALTRGTRPLASADIGRPSEVRAVLRENSDPRRVTAS